MVMAMKNRFNSVSRDFLLTSAHRLAHRVKTSIFNVLQKSVSNVRQNFIY